MNAPAHILPHLTDCGLPGVKAIPYGLHMCHFYQGRADLAAALVPYFIAGLRNRERCIWITAEPLGAADAEAELVKAGFDPRPAIRRGELIIRGHQDWYGTVDPSKPEQTLALWVAEEQRALSDGYTGIRITGNTSFLSPADWPGFMAYEALIDREVVGRRIVTLCSYKLGQGDSAEVAHTHHCTLERPDQGWQLSVRPDYPLFTPR